MSPFSPTNSGRSYGPGNVHAEVGNANSTYHIKMGYGVTPDADAGAVIEFGDLASMTLFVKYSLLNNETGPSINIEYGYGSSDTANYYYLGSTASLAFSKEFEIFFNGRYNKVVTSDADYTLNTNIGNLKLTDYDVVYLQLTYGLNVWFSEGAGLSIYSTSFRGENVETTQDSTFGGSFIFNF